MALSGWPTDAGEGAVATEDRWIQMARLWAPEGVVAGIAGGMAPSFSAGQVTIQPGAAWINGHYAVNDAAAVIPVTADGIVVLRYTAAGSVFSLNFRAGITTPTQTAAVYEIVLAQMTAGVMTDRRLLVAQSGFVTAQVIESTDQTGFSTTFVAGTPVCGLVFTAPPNGKVSVEWGGFLEVSPTTASQRRIELSFEVRAGAVIGSGAVFLAADGLVRGIAIAGALAGLALQLGAGRSHLVEGLTPSAVYNVQTMHRFAGGAGAGGVLERRLAVREG